MSYDNATPAAANYMHQRHEPDRAVETAPSSLSASVEALQQRLDALLTCARRLNNRLHGPEPKAVGNNAMPPYDPDSPIARKIENAHRLINEIDAEMTSLESRL